MEKEWKRVRKNEKVKERTIEINRMKERREERKKEREKEWKRVRKNEKVKERTIEIKTEWMKEGKKRMKERNKEWKSEIQNERKRKKEREKERKKGRTNSRNRQIREMHCIQIFGLVIIHWALGQFVSG